jgi:hypothetical protein
MTVSSNAGAAAKSLKVKTLLLGITLIGIFVFSHPFQSELAVGVLGALFFFSRWPARDLCNAYFMALLVFSLSIVVTAFVIRHPAAVARYIELNSTFAFLPNYQPSLRAPYNVHAMVAFASITFAFIPMLIMPQFKFSILPKRSAGHLLLFLAIATWKYVIFFSNHDVRLIGGPSRYDTRDLYDATNWLMHPLVTFSASLMLFYAIASASNWPNKPDSNLDNKAH